MIWIAASPISLARSSQMTLLQIGAVVMLGIRLAPRLERWPLLQTLCIGGSLLLVAWPVLRLYNHLTMSTSLPMQDAMLAAADAQIGFEWASYVGWVDQHPGLLAVMDLTYTGLTGYSVILFLCLQPARHPPNVVQSSCNCSC